MLQKFITMINYNTNFVAELILYVIRILAAVFPRDSFPLTDIEAVREILDEGILFILIGVIFDINI